MNPKETDLYQTGTEIRAAEVAPPISTLPTKPRSNVYTLLLWISLMFLILAIYLVGWELRNFYHATFGILQPISEVATPSEEETSPESVTTP